MTHGPTINVTASDNIADNNTLSTTIHDVYTSGGKRGLHMYHKQPCYRSDIVIRNFHSEGSTIGGNALNQYHRSFYI